MDIALCWLEYKLLRERCMTILSKMKNNKNEFKRVKRHITLRKNKISGNIKCKVPF